MTTHWHGRTVAPGPVGDCCTGHPDWHDLHETVGDAVLFPGYKPESGSEEPEVSADRRRTLRQAGLIAIGRHPLTGGVLHELASRHRDATSPKSDPFTCGSCWFRKVVKYHGKPYPKCYFGATTERAPRVSNSAATDVRAWWPACPEYSPSDRLSDDAARTFGGDDE